MYPSQRDVRSASGGASQSTNQPSNQQQQGQQQPVPKLPAPSDNALFQSNPDDVDFGFDPASGEFKLFRKEQPAAKTVEPQQKQDQNQQQNGQTNGNGNVDYESRFSGIEQSIQQMATFLIGLAKGLPQQSQQVQQINQQESQPSYKLDFQSDDFAANLVSLINTTVTRAMDERLNPLNSKMSVVDDRIALSDAAMKYGPEFAALYPAMSEIKKSDPNVSWETLYQAMKKLPLATTKSDSTIQTSNGSTGQPQGVAPNQQQQQLQQRANQLNVERGGVPNNIVGETPQVPKGREVEAAFNKAMDELFGGKP